MTAAEMIQGVKKELLNIHELKTVVTLSDETELARLLAVPSVAVILSSLKAEKTGGRYTLTAEIGVYLKTLKINDVAAGQETGQDILDKAVACVENFLPRQYSVSKFDSDDRTLTRKINFEKQS